MNRAYCRSCSKRVQRTELKSMNDVKQAKKKSKKESHFFEEEKKWRIISN